jgi:hypothetical protein
MFWKRNCQKEKYQKIKKCHCFPGYRFRLAALVHIGVFLCVLASTLWTPQSSRFLDNSGRSEMAILMLPDSTRGNASFKELKILDRGRIVSPGSVILGVLCAWRCGSAGGCSQGGLPTAGVGASTPPGGVRAFRLRLFWGPPFCCCWVLNRLQGLVSQASVSHDGMVWYSAHRRVGFTIARAVGRPLASRRPWGGAWGWE